MFKSKFVSSIISMFVFVLLWVILARPLAYFFFPEMISTFGDGNVAWLMVLGYAVGSVCEATANVVRAALRR